MAEASVGVKFSTAEYRFWRNEFEILANELRDQQKKLRPGKARDNLRKREAQIRFMLEKV